MTGILIHFAKRLTLSLLTLCFSSAVLFAQGGTIINSYAKVLTRSDYQITVDNATGFQEGDYVLIIQMKGVSINADNNGYGEIADIVGVPGEYEFLIINSVSGNTISFLNKIKNYDPSGYVQIVKVPYYNNSTIIDDKLICKPWKSSDGTGGILALIVTGSLTLNADIDVSGMGFYGGIADPDPGLGDCAGASGISGVYSFPSTFNNAGYKGEGNASHYTPFVGAPPVLLTPDLRGKGPLFSGGGGGNGRFSGGGGGSNRGYGYRGGIEDHFCDPQIAGGDPGKIVESRIDPVSNDGGVFLGGGGGSSTHLAGAATTPGGYGGGIVFILADSLDGNNRSILASGDSATTATGIYSGAGGGGAGGSIMIFSQKYSAKNFTIKANGAKGGDVNHEWVTGDGGGAGGAGGGGYIALMKPASGASMDISGGGPSYMKNSVDPPESQINGGSPGISRSGVNPVLTGFLFNSIKSEVTGNQTDSICSNVPFSNIIGTTPMGGVPPYDFVWQHSTVSESEGFATIPGATGKDYSPGLMSQTSWFRRIVTDQSPTTIRDTSMSVQIIVQPQITYNVIVTSPDTICFNGDAQLIKQGPIDLVVPSVSSVKYSWQDSSALGQELSTSKEFDPGILTESRKYIRIVYSGRCIDTSAIVKITVLKKLTGNDFPIINVSADTICFGGNTNLNSITPPTDGNPGDYKYKWESSTTGFTGPWIPAGSTIELYDPDALSLLPVDNHFYRRIVFSGESDACKDTSNAAARKVWPVITNNFIKADQLIGYDSIPQKLIETSGAPLGGDEIYTYQWLKDTINLPLAPSGPNGNTGKEYQPPKQTYTVSFIRKVNSSACSANSNSVKITVDPKIGNLISMSNPAKDIIYTGQLSSKLTGSNPTGGSGVANDYAFRWYKSLTGGPSKSEWTPLTDSLNLSPGYLTVDTWFRRDVSSPKSLPRASTKSNIIKITVLPKIINAISPQQAVCYGYKPAQLTSNPPLSGGDGSYKFTWQDSTSGHSWANITGFVHVDAENFSPPALTSPAAYQRIAYSGKNDCGMETSNRIVIKINPVPAVPDPGPSPTIFSPTAAYTMKATEPPPGETGIWALVSGNGDLDNPSSHDTKVSGLDPGYNKFSWIVNKNDLCFDTAYVVINLMPNIPPTGFSPNGDEYNNTFVIEDLYPDLNFIDLSIVNSAGTEVFSISNRSGQSMTDWKGWDGKNSKGLDLPEGTYYYILNVVPKNPDYGKGSKLKGFIVLKRY